MYNKSIEDNNLIYSVDMLRLKTYLTFSVFSEIEFRFDTVWSKYVKRKWSSGRMKDFSYNYNIEIEEGISFWFGFLHNLEKREENEKVGYNFTIEFNPNKIKNNHILMYLLRISGDWYIKSVDIAIDLKINILDLITDISGRHSQRIESRGYDNKTIYIGKGNGRVKIYNKKIESKLDMLGDLTRVEISREFDDFEVRCIVLFHVGNCFPNIYLNRYIYSLSDYKDKTLFALLYAVQNGFPIKDLSRTYKSKIKNMLEGGYKIKFSEKMATNVVRQTIFYYFLKNDKMRFL